MKKLISWNVNGLRACVGKGFLDFFKDADADVFCIQESKLQEGQIDKKTAGRWQTLRNWSVDAEQAFAYQLYAS